MSEELSDSKQSKLDEQSQSLENKGESNDVVMDSDMLKAQEFVISTEKGDTNKSQYTSLQTHSDQLHINL
jgi:hypothetical protein